jgi:hypothetical protein
MAVFVPEPMVQPSSIIAVGCAKYSILKKNFVDKFCYLLECKDKNYFKYFLKGSKYYLTLHFSYGNKKYEEVD